MGRTNWILIALGLVCCVALTLLMQQALQIRKERVADPIATEIDTTLAGRLSGDSKWRVREDARGQKTGILTLHPTLGIREDNLARDAGDLVWRRAGRGVQRVMVVCDSGFGEAVGFSVPAPWDLGRPLERVALPKAGDGDERPSSPSASR